MDSRKMLAYFCAMLLGLSACGGTSTTSSGTSSTSSTDSTGTSSTDSGSTSTSSNALAVVYPDDLAVTSITAASSSTSASLSRYTVDDAADDETFDVADFEEKKEVLEDLLSPADADAFEESLTGLGDRIDITASAPPADCYGPQLNYNNHPEASGGQQANGQLPPGDLGIWIETESSSGEACVVAKVNNIIGQFEALINMGTETVAATLGAASLEEDAAELPEAGETLDLTEIANGALETAEAPVTLDEATITKQEEETEEGDPVFVTELEGETQAPNGDSFNFTTTLAHIPMGEEASASLNVEDDTATTDSAAAAASISDETYCGTLTQAVSMESDEVGSVGNCGQFSTTGITRCTYLEYCKESSTSVTYHLRTAEFCGMDVDCVDVDPADKAGSANTDGWANNFYYTVCQVNPEDGSGRCAQAWQAGMGDGATRVLNVEVEAGGEEGCGWFGYGPDVAATSGVGSIDRMICNWAGPGNNHTGTQQAQKQCFTRDADGKFVSDSDTLAINYAPTTSCNKAAGNFSYQVPNNSSTLVSGATAVTNNLIDLDEIDFEVPELPDIPE